MTDDDDSDDHSSRTVSLSFKVLVDAEPSFGDLVLADREYQVGTAIANLTLPTASGGNNPLRYELGDASQTLPAGLSFDANTRILSGTPTAAGEYAMVYRTTDADGDTVWLGFTLYMDGAPSFGATTLPAQDWQLNTAIEATALPPASGGNISAEVGLTYSLNGANAAAGDPDLPPGLNFDALTRTLSGTPSQALSGTLTYKVSDIDGDSASLGLTFHVDDSPSFGDASIDDRVWILDTAVQETALPQATGGNPPLAYSLSAAGGSLPAGIDFDSGSRTITGTPTAAGTGQLSYRVTDADGDQEQLTFAFSVNSIPSFGGATVADQTWTLGEVATALVLPQASGGDLGAGESLIYSLADSGGNLPDGVSFDAETRTLSGTPQVAATTALTYSVSDSDGDSDSLSFDLFVDGTPTFGASTVADQHYALNQPIAALQLPVAAGGNAPVVYSLAPSSGLGGASSLPAGLSFDAASRTLSGTPTTAGDYSLTYSISDADNDSATIDFGVYVEPLPDAVQNLVAHRRGADILVSWQAPANIADGTLNLSTYEVERQIGTHTFAALGSTASSQWRDQSLSGDSTYRYRVRAKAAVGAGSWSNSRRVGDAPTFNPDSVAAQKYPVDEPMPDLQLPAASSSAPPMQYSLGDANGALPAGLSLDAASRTLSGTPTTVGETALIWRALDQAGDANSLTFSLAVGGVPSFGNQRIADQNYPVDADIGELILPAVQGQIAVTYSLAETGGGALPTGLSFDADSRTLSGTPTVPGLSALIYRAQESGGLSNSLSFNVYVDGAPTFGAASLDDQNWPVGLAITDLLLPSASGGNGALTYSLGDASANQGALGQGALQPTQRPGFRPRQPHPVRHAHRRWQPPPHLWGCR